MDHYGTLIDADLYNEARGRAEWGEASTDARTAALVRGSDYIDNAYRESKNGCGSGWPGKKSGGRSQLRDWPRLGAVDREGDPIPSDVVPEEVERAVYEAAWRELQEPGSLSPDYVASQLVTREKVGPIEVSYAASAADGAASVRPVISAIDEILWPILSRGYCGPAVFVV